jgi:16S rRNA (guanine966-N2)-methyltransferase
VTQRKSTPRTATGKARDSLPRQLRIIGGQWRGRRWRFPLDDIRPTPDRVRETLFNWLQFQVSGAVCLDLFAGSGALGLEALSRGAAEAVFVEQHAVAAAALRTLLADWKADNGSVLCCSADRYLQGAARRFNLVFMDPPYADGLLEPTARLLSAGGWLADDARIYLERSRREPLTALPSGWRELRAGTAGEVGYHLFEHRHAQELDS